jgi:hypothetical protein
MHDKIDDAERALRGCRRRACPYSLVTISL